MITSPSIEFRHEIDPKIFMSFNIVGRAKQVLVYTSRRSTYSFMNKSWI